MYIASDRSSAVFRQYRSIYWQPRSLT